MKISTKNLNFIKLNNSENISKMNHGTLIKVKILILFIYSFLIKQIACNLRIINKESIITIEIKKNGSQRILGEDFSFLPDEVFIIMRQLAAPTTFGGAP